VLLLVVQPPECLVVLPQGPANRDPPYMPFALRARYDEALYLSVEEAALERAQHFRTVVRDLLPPEVTAGEG